MAITDTPLIGAPIIDQINFHEPAFFDDFSSGFDAGTSNTAGARDGKFKQGFYADNITPYGWAWGSDEGNIAGDNFVHAAINYERQVYESVRKPNPSGWSPYQVVDKFGGKALQITSRPVDQSDAAEYEWARIKTNGLSADGTDDGVTARNVRAKYISGMISTYNRFSMSFGRYVWKGSSPYGAIADSADINQNSAIFPALGWLLQDVPLGCDQNGDFFGDGQTTYAPGKLNGGGVMTELDADENFGESANKIHQTSHLHYANQANTVSTPETIDIGQDLLSIERTSGVDITPWWIGFHINGVYRHVVATPPEISQPLDKYTINPAEPWAIVKDANGFPVLNGKQAHADGSDRYMRFCLLSNLARDGKYPRDLARQIVTSGGTLPTHSDTCSMFLSEIAAYPLKTGNPDNFGVLRNGVPVETAGSAYQPTDPTSGFIRAEPKAKGRGPTAYRIGQFAEWEVLEEDATTFNWDWSALNGRAKLIGDDTSRKLVLLITGSVNSRVLDKVTCTYS